MKGQRKNKTVNARLLAIQVLSRILKTNGFAEILLDHTFRKHTLSLQDRSLTTELVMGTLRWLGKLDWLLKQTYSGDWERIPESIQRNLEIALYQVLYTERIPIYAAVNEAVDMAKEQGGELWGRRANGVLRECIRQQGSYPFPSIREKPVESISIQWSHPEWLVKKMTDAWGAERTVLICQANNERPKWSVRINRLRTGKDRVVAFLKAEGMFIRNSPWLDEFVIVNRLGNLFQTEIFRKGQISVQDVSAGLVAHLVDPHPGDRILDLTAAPGGKTTHMAELAEDRAQIVAVDIHFKRLKKVAQNQKRLRLRSVYPLVADSKTLSLGFFDKVLLDAPCSGFGVLRKHPEIKWQRTQAQIDQLVETQKALLKVAHRHVRTGGTLVYSTCSVLPEENGEMISDFLRNYQEYTIEDAHQFVDSQTVNDGGIVETWPDIHDTDGSFAVRLKKGS